MKRLWMWFVLLNKRLYKKITYVCFLVLIPVFVLLLSVTSGEASGVISVILSQEDPQNSLSNVIVEDLMHNSIIIAFREETPEEARKLLQAGKADAVWIFPENMEERLLAYVTDQRSGDGFIRVLEREQTVPLRLARERLCSTVQKQAVRLTFLDYLRQIAPETEEISDQQLLAYLDNTAVSGELFEFYDMSGNRREGSGNYLTATVRGLLVVLAAVSAMVTAMYYQQDYDRGIFCLLPEKYRMFGELGYQLISSVNILFFIDLALVITGLNVLIWVEILNFVLYSICCGLFGILLRTILGGRRGVAVLIPVMTIVMLAVCPVFFDLAAVRGLQFLFPPTYFVNCAFNHKYFLYFVVYDFALAVICAAASWLKRKLARWKIRENSVKMRHSI